MQQLIIRMPDAQVPFFQQLLRNMDYVEVGSCIYEKEMLTAKQRALVDAELKKIAGDKDYLLDWNEANQQLKLD